MTRDPNEAYPAANRTNKEGSLRNFWIAGGVITAVAVVYFFSTGGFKGPNTAVEAAPVQKVHTTIDSDSGMQQATEENTRTPQVGRASGDDGAPKPTSESENPDKDLDSSS